MTTDSTAYPWQLLITGGEDVPGQASTLTLEQAKKLLEERALRMFAAGALAQRQLIYDEIHNEILLNWDTNGVPGKPGVQWLSRSDWIAVASFVLGAEGPEEKPVATAAAPDIRVESQDTGHLPAFPVPGDQQYPQMNGTTKREHFAAQAMAGLCANPGGPFQACNHHGWGLVNCDHSAIAKEAVQLADALLDALSDRQENSNA
jgi:hypothetical protein